MQTHVVSLLCHYSGSNTYIQAVYELANLINLRFRTFPYHSDFIFKLSPHGFRHRKACQIAHRHTGTDSLKINQIYYYYAVHNLNELL